MQVFDNTPAARDANLQSGDEITGVNRASVKGKTKAEVAKMIQSTLRGESVVVQYNKLHADPKLGKTLDIILKKVGGPSNRRKCICSASTRSSS